MWKYLQPFLNSSCLDSIIFIDIDFPSPLRVFLQIRTLVMLQQTVLLLLLLFST
jgi:hypothetical protein